MMDGLCILGILTVCANSLVWGSLANSLRFLNTYTSIVRVINSSLMNFNLS